MMVLDLFCGMGGWSIGFHREGFDCIGLDVVDVGYPYEFINKDIRDFHPKDGWLYKDGHGVAEVIVASPPCTEFSQITGLSFHKGQRGPPDPAKGLTLIRETMRVIHEMRPKLWLLENVYGSIPHITPLLGSPLLVARPWVLWGNIPKMLFAREPTNRGDVKLSHSFERNELWKRGGKIGLPEDFPFDPLRSWRRARIPVFLAQTVAKRCKTALGEQS